MHTKITTLSNRSLKHIKQIHRQRKEAAHKDSAFDFYYKSHLANDLTLKEVSLFKSKVFARLSTKHGSYMDFSLPSKNILFRLLRFSSKKDIKIQLLESKFPGDGTRLIIQAAKAAKEKNCGIKLMAGRLQSRRFELHPAGFYMKLGFEPVDWDAYFMKKKWAKTQKNGEYMDWAGCMNMYLSPRKVKELLDKYPNL